MYFLFLEMPEYLVSSLCLGDWIQHASAPMFETGIRFLVFVEA